LTKERGSNREGNIYIVVNLMVPLPRVRENFKGKGSEIGPSRARSIPKIAPTMREREKIGYRKKGENKKSKQSLKKNKKKKTLQQKSQVRWPDETLKNLYQEEKTEKLKKAENEKPKEMDLHNIGTVIRGSGRREAESLTRKLTKRAFGKGKGILMSNYQRFRKLWEEGRGKKSLKWTYFHKNP